MNDNSSNANRLNEIRKLLEDIDCQLSPENLHCDGEISRAQARMKGQALIEKKARLEKELMRLQSKSK